MTAKSATTTPRDLIEIEGLEALYPDTTIEGWIEPQHVQLTLRKDGQEYCVFVHVLDTKEVSCTTHLYRTNGQVVPRVVNGDPLTGGLYDGIIEACRTVIGLSRAASDTTVAT